MIDLFRRTRAWAEAQATVWSVIPDKRGRPVTVITYAVDRKNYSSHLEGPFPHAAGQVFLLRYDTADPSRNELILAQRKAKAIRWAWIIGGAGAVCWAIGTALFYFFDDWFL